MINKQLTRVIYYTVLLSMIPPLIIIGLTGSLYRFDNFYFKCNDILNYVKNGYSDIGT